MDFLDLSVDREKNKFFLKCARQLFGDDAHAVTTVGKEGFSQVWNDDGHLIAVAWLDDDGKPEFKPMVPRSMLN